MRLWKISLLFEPRDLWVGVYWRRKRVSDSCIETRIYVCLLPCFPFKIEIDWYRTAP